MDLATKVKILKYHDCKVKEVFGLILVDDEAERITGKTTYTDVTGLNYKQLLHFLGY